MAAAAAPPIFKSYGTLTRSTPIVAQKFQEKQSVGGVRTTASVGTEYPELLKIKLPNEFDGRQVWANYLSPIRDQGHCGNCYAVATVDCLADRYNLWTGGQLRDELGGSALTICLLPDVRDVTDYQKAFRNLQSEATYNQLALANAACFGNTLYEAARYCYYAGVPYCHCCGLGKANLHNMLADFKDPKDLPLCSTLQGADHSHCCGDNKTAINIFRAKIWAAIAGVPEDGGSIDLLKFVLYKFGPFAAGFDIYPDFMTYDGKSIYAHEAKEGESSTGGHAVRVVGWGADHWIIANSWGPKWGDNGFFRMKFGTCNIEKNVVVTVPDFESYSVPWSSFAKLLLTPQEQRIKDAYKIDPITRYPFAALKGIAEGRLQGDLSPKFNPVFELWTIKNPIDGDWYAGRDIPANPPEIPKLPAIQIQTLIQKYGISVGHSWWFWLFWLLVSALLVFLIVLWWRKRARRSQRSS